MDYSSTAVLNGKQIFFARKLLGLGGNATSFYEKMPAAGINPWKKGFFPSWKISGIKSGIFFESSEFYRFVSVDFKDLISIPIIIQIRDDISILVISNFSN